MKTKYLLIISLFVILMSMTGISASENVNQTDSLGLSVENNFETEEDEREIIRQKPDEVELKENENGSIDSNILAISNEDEILGKDIYVTGNTFESISNAIAGAESGDIIYLSGTYKNNWKKHIEINKDISIIGAFVIFVDCIPLLNVPILFIHFFFIPPRERFFIRYNWIENKAFRIFCNKFCKVLCPTGFNFF